MANNNQMNALQMLMGGYQQSNQLGTPQAQTIQQPSPFGQLAGGLLGIGGQLLGGPLGGLLGRGGGQVPQLPAWQNPVGMTPGYGSPNPFPVPYPVLRGG